jgi:CRISPR type III-B/RAMP module-associated protein Cmr5
MQTNDQKRAKKAYDIVKNIVGEPDKKSKFKTLALKFPSMVMQCGVLQALAYCKQKDSSNTSGAYIAMNDWLVTNCIAGADIVEVVAADNVDIWQYQTVTREAIAFGVWLKRASATLLEGIKTTD